MTAVGGEKGTTVTESLLLQGVRQTGTELWNDSCGIDDLPYAIANGATGATSNPPIVLGIVRAEGRTWRDRARELAGEHTAWGEGDIAWRLIEEVATRGAGMLAPIHERTGGRQGRQSAQVSPTLYRDADAMRAQASRLSSLAPNLQVKLPVTTAGLVAIEEATYRGIEVNATANFTVAGAIAVAEAVERGLDRRAADGIEGALHPVCTLMVGRLDDWVKAVCDRDGVLLTPGRAEWAGVAVFKRAYEIYRERGYRTRLLGGAFRHHLAWSQLLGGDTILTIPPAWQRWLNASGLPVEARIDEHVEPAILDELCERVPEFRLAYEPDGLAPAELESYGASRRTMRQFLAAYADLNAEVRDAIIPDPDRKPVPA
jgi:transaldolase